ncbi:MAG: DUF541 domain-containing protein [Alphaproteobacteria bacterium]|nr:MAG: DUF541 domain-containing protein [Alphaproteobacteria bacterium]
MTRRMIAAAALAALALAAAPGAAQEAVPRTLQVAGEAEVAVVPDLVRVTVGVGATERSAAAALQAVAQGMAALFTRLDAEGVAERDRVTSHVSLSPVWDQQYGGSVPRITGYRAASGVTVTLRDVARLGSLLDALTRDGANTIAGIAFDVADPGPAIAEARRAAVADAIARARLYAEAAGVRLGAVLSLTETGGTPVPSRLMARSESALPVAPGEARLQASVTMVFAIE